MSLNNFGCLSSPKHKAGTTGRFLQYRRARFIAGGDHNIKHTDWGSRLIKPTGREVFKRFKQLLKTTVYVRTRIVVV
jgi:hypothetical protein